MIALRYVLPLAVLAVFWLQAGAARASGDFSCAPTWTLDQTTYADCDNLPFLSPGNDTRVNLQLLLLDAGRADFEPPLKTDPAAKTDPPPIADSASPFTWEAFSDLIGPRPPGAPDDADANSDYASGEGSRCRSNAAGAHAFEAVLEETPGLPAAEKTVLAAARNAQSPTCNDGAAPAPFTPPAGVRSQLGRQFGEYLEGASAFYGGDFDGARKHFATLGTSRQAWLKETARYMIGRAALNQAQAGVFDDYGVLTTDKVDDAALKAAEQGFEAYLHDYPKGLYAASARGLLRRVAWLGNQPRALAAQYEWSFAHPDPNERNVSVGELVREVDNKLLTRVAPADVADPTLLAILDLMAMRHGSANSDTKPTVIKFEDLAAQKPVFAKDPDLYAYLLAAHRFYVEADPAGALGFLGESSLREAAPDGPINNLAFSRQVLRGEALEAQKNWNGARLLWLRMIRVAKPAFQRPMLNLALASNLEHDGRLTDVFAAGSPIRDPAVREILVRYAAGPSLLAARVRAPDGVDRERRVARFVLLYKDLMRARYGAFAGDATLSAPKAAARASPDDPQGAEPDQSVFDWPGATEDYACEALHKVAAALAADPRLPHALLCLEEFARLSGLDQDSLDTPPAPAELGGAPSQFAGKVFSRLDAYELIIADAKAAAGDRAYALYRAVNCYAPSGNNECGGRDAPRSERARWFHRLKADYPSSDWARDLKYYW